MPLNYAKLVARCAARVPNGVAVRNSAGQCSRGMLDHEDLEQGDTQGFSRLVATRILTLPSADLPSTDVEDAIAVTEQDGTTTNYTVRDIRRMEDGLLKRLVIVPS